MLRGTYPQYSARCFHLYLFLFSVPTIDRRSQPQFLVARHRTQRQRPYLGILLWRLRRFPSLISGVIVLAMFEAAFVGEIVRRYPIRS